MVAPEIKRPRLIARECVFQRRPEWAFDVRVINPRLLNDFLSGIPYFRPWRKTRPENQESAISPLHLSAIENYYTDLGKKNSPHVKS